MRRLLAASSGTRCSAAADLSRRWAFATLLLGCAACEAGVEDGAAFGTGTMGGESGTTGQMPSTGPGSTGGQGSETGEIVFDVPAGDTETTGPAPSCKVVDEMDGVGPCGEKAPPGSFDPDIQWEWWGTDGNSLSLATPLVANLTDDNGDGEIDLCDVPDVVVVASPNSWYDTPARIYVLDGETGNIHYEIAAAGNTHITPALGDIDGDGLVEIVSADVGRYILAFEHDGTPKWKSNKAWPRPEPMNIIGTEAIAIADLDNDGNPEILAGHHVFSNGGSHLWAAAEATAYYSASTAADLDDDGDLEIVLGHAAFHHDGTEAWVADVPRGFPQVADLDADGLPEVLVTSSKGLTLLEHDGAVKYHGLTPTGDPASSDVWWRPATVHDFDGDAKAEFAVSSANHYTVYEGDGSIVWSALVEDLTGVAAGTAFDFLGDGQAEAMYADELSLFVFDDKGKVLVETPRQSVTFIEYPTVADIDNDGSAEVLVVSNECIGKCPPTKSPTLQAIRDAQDRWVPARRIWNQHTYHVTNVREDGTIPQFEPPHWKQLNTFRTQAQIEGAGVCNPAG